MSYESLVPVLRRTRNEQLAFVRRRGGLIRVRRRVVALLPAMVAAAMAWTALSQVNRPATTIRIDTAPVSPAPGPAPHVRDAGPTPTTLAPSKRGAGAASVEVASGDRGRPASDTSSPPAPGAVATTIAPFAPSEAEPERSGSSGCNVVGSEAAIVEVGSDEEYARGNTCEYSASEPGGYIANGTDWTMHISRAGAEWVVSPQTGAGRCGQKGYFQPGDYVRITVGRGSHVAAGPRYGCP